MLSSGALLMQVFITFASQSQASYRMKELSLHIQEGKLSTIEMVGNTYFTPDNLVYHVEVMLSMRLLPDPDPLTLADLLDKYFQKITALGIDKKEFKEDKLAYLSMLYEEEGTLLLFNTTSRKTLEQVLLVAIPAIYAELKMVSSIPSPQKNRELARAAITNAREKAKRIAEKQNRGIGKILKIIDHMPGRMYSPTYLNEKYIDAYEVTVTFELL